MNFSVHILLLIVTTTAVYTAAMTCDKMIWEESSNEKMRTTNDIIMEMGRYTVRTTRRTDSAEVQDLISTLDGASDIQYKLNSFTATLRPKDLKKVLQIDQQNEVAMYYVYIYIYIYIHIYIIFTPQIKKTVYKCHIALASVQ